MSGPEDFNEIDEDHCDDEDDAALNCGLMFDETAGAELCMNAGSEWCDFECPYRDEAPQFRVRKRKFETAPLLDLMEKKP